MALRAVIRQAQKAGRKTPDVAMRWRKESDESWNKALAINPLLKTIMGICWASRSAASARGEAGQTGFGAGSGDYGIESIRL